MFAILPGDIPLGLEYLNIISAATIFEYGINTIWSRRIDRKNLLISQEDKA